jgi:hypothetical protein
MNLSKAGIGMYVTITMLIVNFFGIPIGEEMVVEAITAIITLIGIATWVWGQVDREDLTYGIFRK